MRSARQVAERAETTLRSRMESRRKDAALTMTSVASSLMQSGGHLRDQEQSMAGEYVERTAKQIERAAQYVENADLGEMLDNVEDFARRRPTVFIGAAFALGLLGARFLKSSRRKLPEINASGNAPFSDREVPTAPAIESTRPLVEGAV